MNDAKKISLCLAIIAVLGLVVYQAAKNRPQTTIAEEVQEDADTEAATVIPESHSQSLSPMNSGAGTPQQVPATLPAANQAASVLQATPLSEKEIKSVRQLSTILVRGIAKSANLLSLTNEIKSSGLKPVKTVDENPYTGRLTILRTEDALEGTRYLHLQIIGSTPKTEFMQHSSFQIRPGANSFAKGVEMMQKDLPAGSKVKEKSDAYQSWTVPGGYVARVYTMSMEDLKASKYNAVSKEDIGSVNVVIEQEIHDSEDEH